MALIPIGAVDQTAALVAARISFLDGGAEGVDADTATIEGDSRGFASVTVATGVITVTLASAMLTNLSDIVVAGCNLTLYDTTTDVLTRAQVKSINATTGVIVIWNVVDDGTTGIPAKAALDSNTELHLALFLRYAPQ